MTTLCLAMMVKDNADKIIRTLKSVSNYIDYWVIYDVESADNTKQLIQTYFKEKKIPGEMHDTPDSMYTSVPFCVHFGRVKTLLLQKAQSKANYTILLEPNEIIIVDQPKNTFKKQLRHDIYCILDVTDASLRYTQARITNNQINWRYEGAFLEYLVYDDNIHTRSILNDVTKVAFIDADFNASSTNNSTKYLTNTTN